MNKVQIFTPAEVIRELDVQTYTMLEKEKNRLEELKRSLNVKEDATSIEAEHHIRKISAYIRSKYKKHLDVLDRGVEYPAVSDSRILLSAWQHDCVLVTSNIKEFMLYPLLFGYEEERLYDLLTQQYVQYSHGVHELINEDETFQKMKAELEELYEL